MKLCSYIIREDKGSAPNPFWGYCTLAFCTPNHVGAKLEKGDWIAGFLNLKRNNKLLYLMKVSEILNYDKYFNDIRFSKKIPNLKGSWKERCGDNIYSKNNNKI